jgi:ribosome modulation factor
MHAQTRASLRGVQDYITGVASILDMDICNAGQHINVSGQWLNGYKAHKLYLYREALFSDLFAEMEKDAATCKRVWGRNFGQWNNDPRVVGYTGHGTALNLAHLNEGAQARIEWRMCKFNNVKQFVDLLFLVQEFNLILEQFASGERTTKSAARSMFKKYRACASGRLAAQKRNK